MNQVFYKQLKFGSRKDLFKFVFPSTSPNLGRTIKLAKLKRNNAIVKKLVNIRFDLTVYIISYSYVYLSKKYTYTWYWIV